MEIKTNLLDYKNFLNRFVYQLCSIATLLNAILFALPSVVLSIFLYSALILFLVVNIFRISKQVFLFFPQVMAIFLILIAHLTWVISYFLNEFLYNRSQKLVLYQEFYSDLESFFLANIYLCLFALSIVFFSRFLPKDIYLKTKLKFDFSDSFINKKVLIALLLSVLSFELFFYFSGILSGFMSDFNVSVEGDQVTWFTSLFMLMITFHAVLNILYLAHDNIKRGFWDIIFLLPSILINFLAYSYRSRTESFTFLIVCFAVYILISKRNFNYKWTIFTSIISIVLVFQFTVFLNSMRDFSVMGTTMGATDTQLKTVIGQYGTGYVGQDVFGDIARDQWRDNVSKRMIMNSALSSVLYHNKNAPNRYLYGKALFTDLLSTIPAVIFPNKGKMVINEGLAQTITTSRVFEVDANYSVYFQSFMDFGFLGIIIYPLLINFYWYVIYSIINSRLLDKSASIFVFAVLLPHILITAHQGSVASYTGVLRDILIFLPIFILLTFNLLQYKNVKK